jgi:hypothetical protein
VREDADEVCIARCECCEEEIVVALDEAVGLDSLVLRSVWG